MRKKYLSALLFGALLFASTGTFTSCKDYDDDISGLQEQIDSMETTISTLQNQVNSGYWITSLNSIDGGFAVTFSNGQSYNIVNGKDGADGANGADGAAGKDGTQITIGEDGYWYFDGVKSDYQAVVSEEDGKVKAPYVEDGYWYFYAEDSEEATKSDIKAAGAAYAVAANGGWNLYLPDANGEMNEAIFLPGAAASITSLSIKDGATLKINKYTFSPDDADKKTWKDLTGVDVTSNKYILAAGDTLGLRINPVNVDATGINFDLVNSKNEYLGLTLKAEEYKDYVTSASRAAYGNGLYAVVLSQFELKDDDALDKFEAKFKTGNDNILYALSASTAIRSEYRITVSKEDKTADIGNIQVNGEAVTTKVTVDAQEENKVTVETPADLYDMWLTVSDEDKNLFGIVFDQEKQTFTIKADPDILTKAYFTLTVHTMDNDGEYAKKEITVNVSDKIAISADYSLQTLPIVKDDTDVIKNKNAFTADMATLHTALGDQLDVWKKKVTKADVKYYEDADCKKEITAAEGAKLGIDLEFVNAKGDAKAAIKDAASMKFAVTNADASKVFDVNTEYYAKVTFTGADGELNSVVVPFKFTIPDFADSFVEEPAVFIDGVANAYMNVADQTSGGSGYSLSRAFSKYLDGAKLELDNETKITGDYTSAQLADLIGGEKTSTAGTEDATFTDNAKIILKQIDNDETTNIPVSYKQELIVKASAEDYLGWAYPEGEGEYTFKIKVMSPIYEGTVTAIGSVVNIPATSTDGWKMTNEHIEGKTYNNISYKVLQDAYNTDAKKGYWTRPEIKSVSASSTNERVVVVNGVEDATLSDDGKTFTEGYIQVTPQNIAQTTQTTINVTVEDVWGYKKTNPITVNVTVGE